MDALAGLLDGPRARGAFFLRNVLDPPFAIRIEDRAPLTVVAMVRGNCWIRPEGDEPLQLRPGDLGLFQGPDAYTVADPLDTPVQVVIDPGQRCRTPDGRSLGGAYDIGVRTWGHRVDAETMMIVGTYQMRGAVSQRLLRALPRVVVLPQDVWQSPFVPVLVDQIDKDGPGQEAVLDRLLDLLLVDMLRTWFSRPDAATPGWYRAQGDPIVGRALRLLHGRPAEPWTVATLAAEVGVSRASLARRFTELVGEGPMSFLTGWRLALAADLLREPDTTIGAVARQVGYGSSFALSTAFKRVRGVSPQEHRALMTA